MFITKTLKMKKILLLSFLIISGTVLIAQNVDKKWAIGLGAGLYENIDLKTTGLIGEVYLSRYLSPSFDVMLKESNGFFLGNNDHIVDNLNFLLDFRYKFYNGEILAVENLWQPYLYGGVGYLFDNANAGVNFDFGAGAKYLLKPNLALFAEAGYINGISIEDVASTGKEDFIKAVIGIEIAFGGALDSDNDGVSDKKDKCSNTPLDTKVDKNGCPLDSDADGIADYMDNCPDVFGVVAFNGCPDTDGDGITDAEDSCPEVAGLKLFDGCPDSDGDGLADMDDECPLVAGLAIFNGCPDSDNDGVQDKNDKCPKTLKGAKVDKEGCAIDSDGDGIPDGIDVCPEVLGVAANNGCPLDEEKVEWLDDLKVNSIFFTTNSVEVTTYSKEKMADLVKLMKEHKDYNLNVFGFADHRGDSAYNAELSMRRAKVTVAYLISQGIDENRFSTKALGEEHSVTKDLTEAELQNSRRVDFNLYK